MTAARVLWFNPAVGVAGDMLLGALISAGADEEHVRAQLGALDLEGWKLSVSATKRRGLVATAVDVRVEDHQHHRPWSSIDGLLATADVDPYVAGGARRTFEALALAEAKVHDVSIDEVHFHEVGAVDAIVDIVGSWAALHSLDVTAVHSAAIGLGSGAVRMAHGVVPVPAPATLELLTGLPTRPVDHDGETATPTGVALLATMVDVWGQLPTGTVLTTGRGAGSMDPAAHANVVTAVLVDGSAPSAAITTTVELIETNVDDVTPEVIGHLIERALAAGAHDAWATPIVMKKSRPAHLLSILCPLGRSDELADLLVAETGTLGFRRQLMERVELDRRIEQVEIDGHAVGIKVGPHGAKPEYDDVAAVAAATGRSFREVADSALAAWRVRAGT